MSKKGLLFDVLNEGAKTSQDSVKSVSDLIKESAFPEVYQDEDASEEEQVSLQSIVSDIDKQATQERARQIQEQSQQEIQDKQEFADLGLLQRFGRGVKSSYQGGMVAGHHAASAEMFRDGNWVDVATTNPATIQAKISSGIAKLVSSNEKTQEAIKTAMNPFAAAMEGPVAILRNYLKEETKEYNDEAYKHNVQKAKEAKAKAAEAGRGGHGLAFDAGAVIPNTAELAGVVLGSYFFPPAAPYLSNAYMGKMAWTSFGGGLDAYDEYKTSIGEDPLANETARLGVGLAWAGSEVLAERFLQGITRYMPGAKKMGLDGELGKYLNKKLLGSRAGQEAFESAAERFAREQPKMWEKVVSSAINTTDRAFGEVVEENVTEVAQFFIDNYLIREVEDRDGLRELGAGMMDAAKGAVLMSVFLGPVTGGTNTHARMSRRNRSGLAIGITKEGQAFEIVGEADGKIVGETALGERVDVNPAEIVDQAYITNDEYQGYVNATHSAAEKGAIDALSQTRNRQTGEIEIVELLDNTQGYMVEHNDRDAVVVVEGEDGLKRQIVPVSKIAKHATLNYEEAKAAKTQELAQVIDQGVEQAESEVESASSDQGARTLSPGQMVEFDGRIGVLSIEPDGTHIMDSEDGSFVIPEDALSKVRNATVIAAAGNEFVAVETENGLEVQQEFTSQEEAAAMATVLDQAYQGKRTFRIVELDAEDKNKQNTFQLIGGEYQAQEGPASDMPGQESAATPTSVPTDVATNVQQELTGAQPEGAVQADGQGTSSYKIDGRDVSRGFIKAKIRAAKSRADLNGVEVNNDPDIEQSITDKFPEGVYAFDGDALTREEAAELIEGAQDLTDLEGLSIDNDPELEAAVVAKFGDQSAPVAPESPAPVPAPAPSNIEAPQKATSESSKPNAETGTTDRLVAELERERDAALAPYEYSVDELTSMILNLYADNGGKSKQIFNAHPVKIGSVLGRQKGEGNAMYEGMDPRVADQIHTLARILWGKTYDGQADEMRAEKKAISDRYAEAIAELTKGNRAEQKPAEAERKAAPAPAESKSPEPKKDVPTIKLKQRKRRERFYYKPTSRIGKLLAIGEEPQSLRQAIIMHILTHGVHPDLFAREISKSNAERMQRIGLMNRSTHNEMDKVQEALNSAYPEFAHIDHYQFTTEYLDVIHSLPTIGKLGDALEALLSEQIAETSGEISPEEQAYLESAKWESEQQDLADEYFGSMPDEEGQELLNLENEYNQIIADETEQSGRRRTEESGDGPIQEQDDEQAPSRSRGDGGADVSIPGRGVAPEQGGQPVSGDGQVLPGGTRQAYGEGNKLVSKSRYDELREKMRRKGGQLNAGFDPEMFSMGAEMAAYHIEAGARKFKDFAKAMIDDLGEWVKPYLKSFYMGARNFPGMEQHAAEMDSQDVLDATNLSKIHGQDAQPETVLNNIQANKEITQAGSQADQSPTDAQKEAGNYKKGHVKVQGLDITIENAKGAKRSGKDADGKAWEVTLNNHYGYFKRTEGKDGDQVDVFIGDQPTSQKVFIIDQVDPVTGEFDEHKVMLGFSTKEEAISNYNANYTEGWRGAGAVTEMGIDQFKEWLGDAKRTKKPVSPTLEKETAKGEYKYNLRSRPFGMGNQPDGNFIRHEDDGSRFGAVVYSKPLSKEEISNFELIPIDQVKPGEYLHHFGPNPQPVTVKVSKNQAGHQVVSIIRADGRESNMSVVKFMEAVEAGTFSPIAEKTELTPNQQAELEQAAKDLDEAISRKEAEVKAAKATLERETAKAKERSGLFGDTAGGGLFAGQFVLNQETLNKAIAPFNEAVDKAEAELAELKDRKANLRDEISSQPDMFAQLTQGPENTNLDKNNDDVSNRTGSGESNRQGEQSQAPADGAAVQSERGGGEQTRGESAPVDTRSNREQGGGQSVPDSRPRLFGETGNRSVSPESPGRSAGITGDFDGRGSSIDSTTGNNDGGKRVDGAIKAGPNASGESFKERTARAIKLQKEAEPIPVKLMDEANIEETLPLLLEEQRGDVLKAEKRFFDEESKKSKEWANGKGILFTNGTGTGKTFTGLGIIKRFMKNGAKRVLLVVPASKTLDWQEDAAKINLQGRVLQNTKDSGDGLLITSIENFRANEELTKEAFDLVVYDESHKLMEDKNGRESLTTRAHFRISNRSVQDALYRIQDAHPVWREHKDLQKRISDLWKGVNDDTMDSRVAEIREEAEALQARADELSEQMKELRPALEEQAKKDYERTKVVFLSATPFKSVFNLRYAKGILFDWGTEETTRAASRDMSRVNPESNFFLENFGAQFEWKYHQLQTRPDRNDEAVAMQEVQFSEKMTQAGVLSGRSIESNMDYGRDFPIVATSDKFNSEAFNQAYSDIFDYSTNSFSGLRDAATEVFSSYHEATLLFEVLTTSMSLERIEEHLSMGRKVAVYHRRQNGVSQPPFATILSRVRAEASAILENSNDTAEKESAREALNQAIAFEEKHKALLEFEQTLNYNPAPVQIKERFGDRVAVFTEGNKKERAKMVADFNTDGSGIDILVVQEQSGKEGISLHDTTGKHPRVIMQMSKPNSSIAALQIEGRIYRIGQESNAIFEYPVLGLDMELAYYGSNLNKRLSTTENLAMGNQSRDLIRSFSEGITFNATDAKPSDKQGLGGKDFDKREQSSQTPFQKARLVYATNQKQRGSRNSREGVDFYATPEPVGQKMMEWANVRVAEDVLEPSAGNGAIAMWAPKHASVTAIEPSYDLFAKMSVRTGELKKKTINDTFENLHSVNKFDSVVMNPPFGVGGKTAMDHLEKAFMHLRETGRVVALIPRGKMDSRLDKFLYGKNDKGELLNPNAHLVASIDLPGVTFQQAGTSVNSRIVIIDKVAPDTEGLQPVVNMDLTDAKTIDELFDRIENVSIPGKVAKTTQAEIEVAKPEFAGQVIDQYSQDELSYLEQKHSRTGATRHTVVLSRKVDPDRFNELRSMAKGLGGFYNGWNRGGARAGFEFKTEDAAREFEAMAKGGVAEDRKGSYKTLMGDDIAYQLAFNFDQKAQPAGDKPQGRPSIRRLEPGEFSTVESKYTVDKHFVFNGTNKVESVEDVAFIFRQLETKAVENMFLTLVDENGKPTIIHLGMGSRVGVVVDFHAIADAVHRFKPKKIYLTHNHPSGNLQYSEADVRVHKKVMDAFGDIVGEHIIINTTSGKYATFRYGPADHQILDRPTEAANVKDFKVLAFDKNVFKEGYNQIGQIRSVKDVSAFISGQRFSKAKKISALILSRSNQINAYVHLSAEDIKTEKGARAVADELQAYVSRFGGAGVIIVSNDKSITEQSMAPVANILNYTDTGVLDVVYVHPAMFKDVDASEPESGYVTAAQKAIADKKAEENDLRYKRGKPRVYSPTERALSRVKQEKAAPDQMKAMLLKNGAKEVELNWMGWNGFVEGRKSISKAEVQSWIEENRVELEEVEKGIGPNPNEYSIREDGDVFDVMMNGRPVMGRTYGTREEAEAHIRSRQASVTNNTRYGEYVLMGGDNYREILLTMKPSRRDNTNTDIEFEKVDGVWIAKSDGQIIGRSENISELRAQVGADAPMQSKNYKSKHWEEENVVVHVRAQDFTDKDGRKILLIEEVQSDWAQQGKKIGFAETSAEKRQKELLYKDELTAGELSELSELYNEVGLSPKVIDMPFKQTNQWVGLALKRMMQEASEGGYDMIGWTTGQTQADRFDLSQRVSLISLAKTKKGTYRLVIEDSQGFELDGYKGGGMELRAEEVENHVGKEYAKALIEGADRNFGKPWPKKSKVNPEYYTVNTKDFKVGGEGMKAFYDKILPATAKKVYGKQAEVGTTEITTNKWGDGGALESNQTQVHAIELTHEMKDAGAEEQSMFKKDVATNPPATAQEYIERKAKVKESFDKYKAVATKAKEASKKYGTTITTVRKIDELPDRVRRKVHPDDYSEVQALYDPQTGMVFLVSDNLDPAMTDKVIMHEVLAHKGLREVLGSGFGAILDEVYKSIPEADRKAIAKLYKTDNKRVIADEYIAQLAEGYKRPNMLNRIIAKVRNLLRQRFGLNYSKADIMYLLSKSEDYFIMKAEPNPADFSTAAEYLDAADQWNRDVRYRRKEQAPDEDVPADLSRTGDGLREKVQDRMISVKRIQQEVADRLGIDRIEWWMDAYEQENRSHGRILHATERMYKDHVDPLIKAAYDLAGSESPEALSELQRYLKAKHAPERNRVISKRKGLDEVENQSGFTDQEAEIIVNEYEATRDQEKIDRLWEKVRSLTSFTLDKWLEDGFISKAQYNEMKSGPDAYQYYVPLRGHADESESVFEYQNNNSGKSINPFRAAKGRESESDDPIQYMANMAQTAIVMGENNRVKQYAYRMAANHPNPDLYHIKKAYYVSTGITDKNGKEVYTVTYERPDQELWDEGKVVVRYNNKRMAIDKHMNEEHEIEVMVGGERIKLVFENPEVGNAINKNNVAVFSGQNWLDALARAGGTTTRLITANFTAKNPGFIVPNTVRDVAYAWISHAIKGGGKEAADFATSLRKANRAMSDYSKWEKAKKEYENATDKSAKDAARKRMDKHDTEARKLMEEFMSNGAATGYVYIKDVDTLGKEIDREIKRLGRAEKGNKIVFNSEGYIRVWHKTGEVLEALAQRSENMSRLATYIVARNKGESAADAATQAKNVTVNFNRKGSQSNIFGSFYAFLNASIQGGENIARIAKENPGKFVLGASMLYSWGFLTALLSHLNDDDEEKENKYKNLNDYTKQNNFTIRYGKSRYISIPLPHGWRMFYGLGVSTMENLFLDEEKKSKFNWAREDRAWDKLSYDFADRAIDAVSSVNPVAAFDGGELTVQGAVRVLSPTVVTPWTDLLVNKDFAGREIARKPYTKQQEEFDANAGQFRNNVNPILKRMTDKLYVWGGGDLETYTRKVVKDGELQDINRMYDYNPSNLEHIITYYTGGRGRFFNDLYKTTSSVVKGMANIARSHPEPFEAFDANDIPVVNRFNRQAYDYDDFNWYYNLRSDVALHKYNRSRMSIERQVENINPRMEMLDDMIKDIDKKLKELRQLRNNPAILSTPEQIIEIRKTEKQLIKEFRKAVKDIQK